MASRVNTKFVVLLASVLVLMFGGLLGAFLYLKFRSGADMARAADKKMAAGDFAGAQRIYAKAVYRDSNDLEVLGKWLACLKAWSPESQTEFESMYVQAYRPALRQIALVKRSDIGAHREYLDELLDSMILSGFNRSDHDFVISEAQRTLDLFKGQPADGPWNVLRRYRAIPNTRIMTAGVEIKQEAVDQAKEDLLAVLKADPTDEQAAIALYDWHEARAAQFRRENRDEAPAISEEGRKGLFEFASANPKAPAAQMLKTLEELDAAQREAVKTKKGAEAVTAYRETVATYAPNLDAIADLFRAAPVTRTLPIYLHRYQDFEKIVSQDGSVNRTERLVRDLLAKSPKDVGLNYMLAVVLGEAKKIDEANAQLQAVRELPPSTISLEGMQLFSRRTEAAYLQTINYMKLADLATPEDRPKAIERVKKARDEFASKVTTDTPQLWYIDAVIATAEQRLEAAHTLLVRYNRATQDRNVDALWALAQVTRQIGRPGEAIECINRIMAIQGPTPQLYIARAQVEQMLGNNEVAAAMLRDVIDVDAKNETAKQLLRQIELQSGAIKSEDAVVQLLLDAERLANGSPTEPPDIAAAVAMLEQAAPTYEDDPRIMQAIAIGKARIGSREDALAAVRRGLAKHPDHAGLKKFETTLANDDPLGAALQDIDSTDAAPAEKSLRRYSVYRVFEKLPEADAELDKAFAAAPDDRRVVEERFLRLAEKKDFDGASKVADAAAAKDFDGVGGLWYRARLQVAREQYAESLVTMDQITQKGAASVEQWRLRARVEQVLGRDADAAKSYGEALRLRPNDVTTHVAYVAMLAADLKYDEALSRARDALRYGQQSPQFMELYLNLEAVAGDRKLAVARREKIARSEPSNLDNKAALVGLYLEYKQWEPARAMIDEMRAGKDSLRLAVLDARYWLEREQVDAAKKVIDDYLAAQDPASLSVEDYIGCASLFSASGQLPEAVALLESARPRQSPARMEVDRALGDTMAKFNQMEAAAEAYGRVIAGKADGPQNEVRVRLAEVLSSLARYDEASAMLSPLETSSNPTASVLLLRAEISSGLKDDKAALAALDRAVQAYPSNPLVYVRRAEYLVQTKQRSADALADLNAALKVDPGYWPAYRARARHNALNNRMTDAINDLREAVRANPRLDDVRATVMGRMIELGRDTEAAELADEAIKLRPTDVEMIKVIGEVFMRADDWPRAVRYLKLAWALGNREDVGRLFLTSLLASTQNAASNEAEAEAVLRVLQPQIETSNELLTARATLLARRGRSSEVARDIIASLKLAPVEAPSAMVDWLSRARRAVPRPPDLVAILQDPSVPPAFSEWVTFFSATLQSEDMAARSRGITALEDLVSNGKDMPVVQLAHRLLGSIYYADNQYERALAVWLSGTAKFPNDWEIANNLAYVLAKDLGRAEEALPYAERAAAAAPDTPEAVDTLGLNYLMVNRLEDAERVLAQASLLARTANSRVPILLHSAELRNRQGRKDEARSLVSAAEQVLANNPNLSPQYKKELDQLRTRIDAR